MKTAGRENPNRGVAVPRNRAQGAVGQNRSRSVRGAEKQETFRPTEKCFFLTSPFIELIRTWPPYGRIARTFGRISLLWPSHASRECTRPENQLVYKKGVITSRQANVFPQGSTPTAVSSRARAHLNSVPGPFRGHHATYRHTPKCKTKGGSLQTPGKYCAAYNSDVVCSRFHDAV